MWNVIDTRTGQVGGPAYPYRNLSRKEASRVARSEFRRKAFRLKRVR